MKKILAFFGVAVFLSGCNGGGGGSDPAPAGAAPTTKQAGAYAGTVLSTQLKQSIKAGMLISADGDVRYAAENCVQVASKLTFNGNNFSGIGKATIGCGYTFLDGSTTTAANVTGTLADGVMTANYSAGGDTGTLSFKRDSISDRGASLTIAAGTYKNGSSIVTVDTNGVLTGSDGGGNIAGRVTVPDASVNIYKVEYTYTPKNGSPIGIVGMGTIGDGKKANDTITLQYEGPDFVATEQFTRQ